MIAERYGPVEANSADYPVQGGATAVDTGLGHILAGLTEPQREAVLATEGPVLVLAAAGSGKTRVITRRMAYLIGLGVPPWSILALTFTNKAAGEMRERVYAMMDGEAAEEARGERRAVRGLTVTTFHSLCARLLRRYAPLMEGQPGWGIAPDYTIYDSDDQRTLIKRVITSLDLSTSNWSPAACLGKISDAKNNLLDSPAFEAQAYDFNSRMIAKIYRGYEKALRAANAVDFDDLLMLTVRLLRESEAARREVQGRFEYLLIDEYQDTNHAQFLLSTLLVSPPYALDPAAAPVQPNICVVGDPDQSIYGWRGADISNILDFEAQYPGTQIITLGQNFRSTAPILAVADYLIKHNTRRKDKELFTTRQGGEPPQVVLCRDEHHEAQLVVDWCRRLGEGDEGGGEGGGIAWKDMAIFYRNNALSRVMEDGLRQAGIPYVIARGTAFYQREEVRDLVAYLRVVANPSDDISLLRIINKPARRIGKPAVQHAQAEAARLDIPLLQALRDPQITAGVSSVAAGGIQAFLQMLDHWTGAGSFLGSEVADSLTELIDRVLRESGLEKHYRKVAEKSGSEADAERIGNLEELISSAADFAAEYSAADDVAFAEMPPHHASEPQAGDEMAAAMAEPPPLLGLLRAYLESIALVADADKVDPARGAITLMTLHAAKGLEFPAVAMIGLEEGLLPSMRAMESEEQLEEERRLAFVGITRAMEQLLITSGKYRTHRGMRERTIPSRFLREMPPDHLVFSDQSDAFDDFDEWDNAAGGYRELDEPRDDSADEPADAAPARSRRAGRTARAAGSRAAATAKYPVGARVRHPQFGIGTVRSLKAAGINARAEIAFADVGTKTLVLQYARLERLD